MAPSLGNGKICYIEIPAADIPVFLRFTPRSSGGTPASEHGLRVYMMVDDIEATMASMVAPGGEIFEGVGAHRPEINARFRDPYGNIFSLCQEGDRQRNKPA
jgi:predicted enzyme related to lactoylglutathione lyase